MSKAIVVSMKNHLKPHNGKSHHPHHRPGADKPRRRRKAAASTATAPPKPRTGMSKKKLIEESRRWLSIINSHKLNDYKRRKVVTDTLDNFRLYYNKGYLEYRKSVTEGGEFAAIEWSGKGSYFEDITGRKFIDCLGRLRHLLGGDQPPQGRARGEVAARADAPVVPGAPRPAARSPGRAAGRAGPRRPPVLLLHQQRDRRHRRGHEAGPPLHQEARLHLLRSRVPRQVLRLALPDGEGGVPPRLRAAPPGHLLRSLRRRRGRGGRAGARPRRSGC